MSLVIDLPRPVEQRLEDEAAKAGVSKTEYAADLLTKNLPAGEIAPEETPDQQKLRITFDELLARAEALVPAPPKRPATPFERILQEKFRKQGFVIREDAGE